MDSDDDEESDNENEPEYPVVTTQTRVCVSVKKIINEYPCLFVILAISKRIGQFK